MRGKAIIDYSFVTGESEPVEKQKGDKVYAGGRQTGDSIELTVIKKVSNSYLTQLWNDAAFTKKDQSRTASQIADQLGRRFTYIILLIAFGTLIYWLPRDTSLAVNAFTAVLIIACPCAVALSIPFTLGNVIRILGRFGFYLKNTNVIEHLARANTVVFDKTGTITLAGRNTISYEGDPLTKKDMQRIRLLASQSSHPVSRQIVRYMDRNGNGEVLEATGRNDGIEDYREQPGKGIRAVVHGVTVEIRKAQRGGTEILIDGIFRGIFQMQYHYREGLASLINLWKQKYRLYLISGDNDMERKSLEKFIPAENLHFDQSPADKLNFITHLMESHQDAHVIMIGDGLNDAGALQKSHAGIVVAENTNNFTPACDAILDAAQFTLLPAFVELSRKSLRIVYLSYGLAVIYNIIGLSYAVQGTLSPVIAAILMPLSSVTIVLFGVGMSSLAARRVS
jgi:Cu+-exporting ATPase